MADTKISALTEHTAPIATDLLPVVDVTAGETKSIPLGTLIPDGGTTGQVLTKASGDDYDSAWITPFSQQVALFYKRGADGSNDSTGTTATGNPLKYDQEIYNSISGLVRTIESGFVWKSTAPGYVAITTSTYQLPVGTYLIKASCVPYSANSTRLFIRDHDTNTILFGGPTAYSNLNDGSYCEMTYIINVSGSAKKVSFEFSRSLASSNGLHDGISPAGVQYENFGELLIQKIA